MINATSVSSICSTWNEHQRCQDVRKQNHSRLTEQPLVTDNDSTTVKGISLSHETSYVHQAPATYFNRAWQQDPSYARVYEATS